MKLSAIKLYTILFCTLFIGISESNAQDGFDNPITKAMMKVYQQQLDEDPQDYETYFKRANEYYNHNQYAKALTDINNALKYMPSTEIDLKYQSLSLRASIYEVTNNYEKALIDLNEAYIIEPNSYEVIYRKANAEYLLNRFDEAKTDYQRMLRLNNRSVEALIGLSRIAVTEKNLGLANEYADNAVSLAPTDANVYLRRASVRKLMGNNTGAVDDLIIALSTGKETSKALYELVDMGNNDYNAVMTGLSNAIRHAPRVGMYYYIRGIIAKAHYNYVAALADFKKIINENLYNYHGIYKELADCQYALGNYNEAIYNINYAINATKENSEYYTLKAKILRALNRFAEGVDCCNSALTKNPNLTEAISVKGLCLTDLGEYDQAVILFGEATLNEANNPYNYMLRANVIEKYLKQQENANTIYERIVDIDNEQNDVKSLKGFALLALKRNNQAKIWIENILSTSTDNDGIINYYAACLYSQLGDFDKALECMKVSLQKGYANYHDWTLNYDANINIAPLRENKRFQELIMQYSLIFK